MSSAQIAFDVVLSKADQRGETVALNQNLTQFAWLHRVNFEFRQLVSSKAARLEQILDCIAEIPGFVPCQTFFELVAAIVDHHLVGHIEAIADTYTSLLASREGKQVVVVVTAVSLDDSRKQAVAAAVESALGTPVLVKNEVDASLIFGTIFKLPNGKQFDFSAKKRLTEIKSHILEGVS